MDNRSTENFLKSLFDILKLNLSIQDHTTISRRGRKLNMHLPKTSSKNIHLVIERTGIRVYGDGEWKAFKHGREKKTEWIKVHLGVDAHTGQIRAVEITDDKVYDRDMVKNLLK
ncbi:MAG: transposase [Brevinematia bacterium]